MFEVSKELNVTLRLSLSVTLRNSYTSTLRLNSGQAAQDDIGFNSLSSEVQSMLYDKILKMILEQIILEC
jgi:hypothetical protein